MICREFRESCSFNFLIQRLELNGCINIITSQVSGQELHPTTPGLGFPPPGQELHPTTPGLGFPPPGQELQPTTPGLGSPPPRQEL